MKHGRDQLRVDNDDDHTPRDLTWVKRFLSGVGNNYFHSGIDRQNNDIMSIKWIFHVSIVRPIQRKCDCRTTYLF